MPFAPVLIPIAPFVAALVAVVLILAAKQLLRPIINGFATVLPVVGKYFAQVAQRLENWIVAKMIDASKSLVKVLALWLATVGELIDGIARDVNTAFNATVAALDYLADVRIPQAINAAVQPIRATARALDTRLDQLVERVGDFKSGIEGRVRQLTEQMWGLAIQPLNVLTNDVIPDLRRWADRQFDTLTRLTTVVLPREIAEVGERVGNLRDYVNREAVGPLREHVNVAAPAIAFVTAIAIPEINVWRRFRPKADRLCTIDLDDFDEFLGLALIVPALPLILEAVEGMARNADEVLAYLPIGLRHAVVGDRPGG